jgi:head-tail adaptor
MRGGDLDQRITLQRKQQVDDPEYGPQPASWQTVAARVPAQVLGVLPSRSETFGDATTQSASPSRVRIRYMRSITADMRIILHEEVDTIHQLKTDGVEIGRREWTEFMVEEFADGNQ